MHARNDPDITRERSGIGKTRRVAGLAEYGCRSEGAHALDSGKQFSQVIRVDSGLNVGFDGEPARASRRCLGRRSEPLIRTVRFGGCLPIALQLRSTQVRVWTVLAADHRNGELVKVGRPNKLLRSLNAGD
jgi:hypothetical protein